MARRKHTQQTKRKIARALLSKKRKNKIRNKKIKQKIAAVTFNVGNEITRSAVLGAAIGTTKYAIDSKLDGESANVFNKEGLRAAVKGAAVGTATYGIANTVGLAYDSQSQRLRAKIDKGYAKKRRRRRML